AADPGHETRDIVHGNLLNHTCSSPQSICTPDDLTTSRHFGRSESMNAANWSGVIGAGSPPTLLSAATTSGSSKIRFTSALILSTIGRGVPAGANRPC